ncbi:MAG: adenylate/guanylate cyclase domain-containing protein [Ignavibacteriales bacterium]|nr:adenylate/guanylate cyclase domain-containing protein [Ignavibacteriales bacterium]
MASYDFKKKYLPVLNKIGIGLGIGVFVLLLTQEYFFEEITFLKNVDLLTIDYRYQGRYEASDLYEQRLDKDVVIVGISDDDLKSMPHRFPFPRWYYAHLIENLERAGARVIAFDIEFQNPAEGDSVLREVLKKYDNVILATKVPTGVSTEKYEVRSVEQDFGSVFFDVNRNIGMVDIFKDRDGVCRRYLPMITVGDNLAPTFAFSALNQALKPPLPPLTRAKITDDYFVLRDRQIPKFDPQTFLLSYYGPNETFRYEKFSQVIDDEIFKTKDEMDIEEDLNLFDEDLMKRLKGKIVLIGSVMPEERDIHAVPIFKLDGDKKNYNMHGVEIHATAVQNLLDQNFISRPEHWVEASLILFFSLVTFLGILRFRQLKLRYAWLLEGGALVITIVLIAGLLEVSILAFTNANMLMNVVNPSFSIILAYFGTAVYQYLQEREQKALIKNVFGHYLSPTVVNILATDPSKARLGGDRRELTVFFSDIANFTTVSESFKQPEGLVDLLNEYLSEMTSIVLKTDGTLDKYVGDAIIAFWGAPLPQKDHAYRGCVAALEMQRKLAELRPKWKKEGKPELSCRCGVNTGTVIVGNIGGKDRFDYTVIGDSVNLASRMEGANKQYHSSIMISESTYGQVKDKVIVRELDLLQVKGKTEPVKVFELLGTASLKLSDGEKQSLELYHEGLKLYRKRTWDEAIAYFNQSHQLDPKCHVAQIYAERAGLYQLNPPPEEWNGVFVMTTK